MKRFLKSGRLRKFLTVSAMLAVALCVMAFAGEATVPTAQTVISSMTTGLTSAQSNMISMTNSVVPVGVGVYAVTGSVRLAKKMFRAAGGTGA